MRPGSHFQIVPKWPKIGKTTMTSQFADVTSSPICFWRRFIFLVKFSYLSKFHVNIITVSGVMTIYFYKRLTRNSEIGNTTIWVLCPISGDWGELEIPNLTRMFLIKCYWMLQNARFTAFTVSELLKEN